MRLGCPYLHQGAHFQDINLYIIPCDIFPDVIEVFFTDNVIGQL